MLYKSAFCFNATVNLKKYIWPRFVWLRACMGNNFIYFFNLWVGGKVHSKQATCQQREISCDLLRRMMPTFSLHMPVPRPSYTQARENLVRAIPSKLLCLLACGGRDCRYEGPECWKANQQAIRGLFSSWWGSAFGVATAVLLVYTIDIVFVRICKAESKQ